MKISGVEVIVQFCLDMEKSKAWYEDFLGLEAVAYGGVDKLSAFVDPGPVKSFFPPGAIVNYDIAMRMGNEMFDRLVAARSA